MLRITTNTDIDPMGVGIWSVRADWYGEERTIFTGSIFECCTFSVDNA